MKVDDKRHWARGEDGTAETAPAPAGDSPPDAALAEIAALQARAEGAERKLREVQEAFLAAKADLDATRARLERDLPRKVEVRFGELVADLLDSVDDLDRAIEAGTAAGAAASPLVQGVVLARDRFVAALQRAGLERIDPLGAPYDPNLAEAVGILPVDDEALHDTVAQVARPGYRLGDRVVRPARVLVGRLVS